VLIAVDLGNGVPVAIGRVDESNPQAVRRFLEPLVQQLGVSVVVTDDLASFRPWRRSWAWSSRSASSMCAVG